MITVLAAGAATLVTGDSWIYRVDLVAGPTVDATLTLASAPSGGIDRAVMAAKAGEMATLELQSSNQLQEALAHITTSGTGAKAVVQYETK